MDLLMPTPNTRNANETVRYIFRCRDGYYINGFHELALYRMGTVGSNNLKKIQNVNSNIKTKYRVVSCHAVPEYVSLLHCTEQQTGPNPQKGALASTTESIST